MLYMSRPFTVEILKVNLTRIDNRPDYRKTKRGHYGDLF